MKRQFYALYERKDEVFRSESPQAVVNAMYKLSVEKLGKDKFFYLVWLPLNEEKSAYVVCYDDEQGNRVVSHICITIELED